MVSEANIMASLADGVIYVSECGYTPKKAVQQSQKVLEIAKANVVGSVLNKIDLTRTYGKRGHYYYY
jgi:Mrp family chromosome partitioning ATPase